MSDGHDDMAKAEAPQLPRNYFTKETASAIVFGSGSKYRRVTRTLAVQLNQPFAVDTGHGIATGLPGDYLCIDSDGFPYPVTAAVFVKSYTPAGRARKAKDAKS